MSAVLSLMSLAPVAACPEGGDSSQPVITLTVTDCAKEDITMTPEVTKTSGTGNQWNVRVTIEVKCAGTPVPGAELKAEFWWPNGEMKLTTGSDGKASHSRSVHGDPAGSTYEVTIEGNNGSTSQTFTVP